MNSFQRLTIELLVLILRCVFVHAAGYHGFGITLPGDDDVSAAISRARRAMDAPEA
jgi:hypothetical protein